MNDLDLSLYVALMPSLFCVGMLIYLHFGVWKKNYKIAGELGFRLGYSKALADVATKMTEGK